MLAAPQPALRLRYFDTDLRVTKNFKAPTIVCSSQSASQSVSRAFSLVLMLILQVLAPRVFVHFSETWALAASKLKHCRFWVSTLFDTPASRISPDQWIQGFARTRRIVALASVLR